MNFSTLLKIGENLTENSTYGERAVVGLQVVAIGMGVVFGVLILLIGILQIFKLFSGVKTPAAKETKVKNEVSQPATAPANTASVDDEQKMVAIATAAIAASRGKNDVDFRVLSFAPVGSAPAQVASKPAETAAPAPAAPAPEAAPAPAAAPATAPVGEGEKITAPLPGNILDVKVANGATVKKGDILCVLEAMKMENEIVAPKDGTIVSVSATKGSSVNTGDLLFVLA